MAHSATLIDRLYVSSTDHLSDVSVPCMAISDHYTICFSRTTSKNSIKKTNPPKHSESLFKMFSEEIFLSELSNALQSFSVTATDSHQNFTRWTQVVMSILNKHAPFKTKGEEK